MPSDSLRSILTRLLVALGLIFALFSLPWWGTAILSFWALIAIRNYYEVLVPALIFDFVYGSALLPPLYFRWPVTLCFLLLVVVVNQFRTSIMVR